MRLIDYFAAAQPGRQGAEEPYWAGRDRKI
jgi:hypothetical protein